MRKFTREIRLTEDGSKTIYIPELDENYHSTHGALQEARHVFIQHGFHSMDKNEFSILEIGFGTGLNALLTAIECEKTDKKITYHGLEAFPVEREILDAMDYANVIQVSNAQQLYDRMHQIPFGELHSINSTFDLLKIEEKLEQFEPIDNYFDLIYFDAFGPRAQVDMWQIPHFQKLYNALKPGGVLVTYCAKGQVKRDLQSVGFCIEALPGPPGKREMTRCLK